eukprot:jgi/Chrpa1/22093/Chrysochromulina_OHIO_Genome00009484-RA
MATTSTALISTEDGSLERLAGDLADQTRLPRELIQRFGEMWHNGERPFFSRVDAESGLLPFDALEELVRSLKISQPVLYSSVARVISGATGAPVTFEQFVRGYAKLHARTLKEALPFAFAVFDLDGDGILAQEEFRKVLDANLEQQSLDPTAINRVLGTAKGKDAAGVTYDAFRYFASLTSETILACCGSCLHVRDFYVPLKPLGSEAEEAAEEAERAERVRRDREREHAPRKAAASGADGPDAAGGSVAEPFGDLQDKAVDSFSHPEFLAALESLRTTPEERAERCRAKGNEALKHKKAGIEKAVDLYTEGLDERCTDATLHAALLANRCAAHTMLHNHGKALADASAALAIPGLAHGSALKVSRRGAHAALQLGKLAEAEALVARAEAAAAAVDLIARAEALGIADAAPDAAPDAGPDAGPDAATKASASPSGAEMAEIAKIKLKLVEAREEMRRRESEAAAREHAEAATARAITARGLKLGPWQDERLKAQCVGAASGARVWFDEAEDELYWPLLLLYPEAAQSDVVQEISEREILRPHLVEMFGDSAEHSPPWDHERRYAVPRLVVYAPFTHHQTDQPAYVRIDIDDALLPQLHALQPLGYEIPGVPILHVVVSGSVYEGHFVTPKVLAIALD